MARAARFTNRFDLVLFGACVLLSLVSMATTVVRWTSSLLEAVSAVASTFLPSKVTETESRSTSASPGTETSSLTCPLLCSAWSMLASSAA